MEARKMTYTYKDPNRDPVTGKFVKGNRPQHQTAEIREMRKAIKSEIVKCAYSLVKDYGSLDKDLKNKKLSRYQHLLNKAVKNGDMKLVSWVTEMAVGRPKFEDVEDKDCMFIPVTKEQQGELIDLALQARHKKLEEESSELNQDTQGAS